MRRNTTKPGDDAIRLSRFEVGEDRFIVLSVPITARPQLSGLSSAEHEVLDLLVEGLSNAQIARRRRVAVRTVANQIAAIFRKVGVHSRVELIAQLARGAIR